MSGNQGPPQGFPNQGGYPGYPQQNPQQGNQMMNQQGMQQQQQMQMQQNMMGGYNNYNRPQMGQYPNQQYQNQPQMNNFQQQNYPQRFPPNQAYNQGYQNPGAYQQQMNPAFMNQRMGNPNMMRMGNPTQNPQMMNPQMNPGMNQGQMNPQMNQNQNPMMTPPRAVSPASSIGNNMPVSQAPNQGYPPSGQNVPPNQMAQNPMNQMNQQPNQTGGPVQNQNQTEPSPQTPRSRNIFDDLLEGFEDVFARLIAKDEMLGCYDKDEISCGVEHSVNKFIQKAQVVELYFNQMIARRSAGNPQDVLTEEIKDLKAEIHRKDQWIQKMHGVSKKWCDMLQTEEQKKESKDSMTALETMSANPNFRKK